MNVIDWIFLGWVGGVSLVGFAWHGFDKWRAGKGGRRVPEATLLWLAACGGWPGILAGIGVFRHKSSKGSFQLKLAGALIPFAGLVWGWWWVR